MALFRRWQSQALPAQRGLSIFPAAGRLWHRLKATAAEKVEPWGPREPAVTEDVEPQLEVLDEVERVLRGAGESAVTEDVVALATIPPRIDIEPIRWKALAATGSG